ncbi:MAG: hypothetical protein ACTSUP_03025 [Candidatus Heimdallarchaeaceae archaeon]
MKVEIKQKRTELSLCTVPFGSFFWWEGELYQRICHDTNSIDADCCFEVRTDALQFLDEDTIVIPETRKLKLVLDEGE